MPYNFEMYYLNYKVYKVGKLTKLLSQIYLLGYI